MGFEVSRRLHIRYSRKVLVGRSVPGRAKIFAGLSIQSRISVSKQGLTELEILIDCSFLCVTSRSFGITLLTIH